MLLIGISITNDYKAIKLKFLTYSFARLELLLGFNFISARSFASLALNLIYPLQRTYDIEAPLVAVMIDQLGIKLHEVPVDDTNRSTWGQESEMNYDKVATNLGIQ